MKPKVSLIISVLDQISYTKKCLRAICETLNGKIEYEVLIVDDGSKDETIEYLSSLKHPFRVIYNSEKKGFAKNNNQAASQAKADFLCLLNNDVFVDGDWLIPMVDFFGEKKNVGVVGNVQRLAGSKRYDHMGVVFGPKGNPRHYGQGYYHRPFKGEVRQWSAVTAACCVVRKVDFLKINGFNEIFLNGCEDVDLCLKYNRLGYRNYVFHDIIVDHVKGASEGRKRYNEHNSKTLLELWGEEIRKSESVKDQILHAQNYIYLGFTKPFSTNFWKWLEAFLLYLRLKRLK